MPQAHEAAEAEDDEPEESGEEFEDDEELIDEYYTNATGVEVGLFDVALSIGLSDASDPDDREVLAVVRMSPQHALILTAMLAKSMAAYERTHGGAMPIHPEVVKALGLDAALKAIRSLPADTQSETSVAASSPEPPRLSK